MRFIPRNTPSAEQDTWEAVRCYDAREAGPGGRFLDAVDRAVASLEEDAMIYRLRRDGLRRVAVPGFGKYGVFYRVTGEQVLIVAVFHEAQHPGRLRARSEGNITNYPNREDEPDYIVKLLDKVITVSLETQKLIAGLPKLTIS